MDDAPHTEDLDLASVTTCGELAALLQTVHLRADRPSLRALEARTRHDKPPLSKTVISEMLNGVRFPRKAVMATFLRACGVRDDQIAPWLYAWERVAIHERGRSYREPAVLEGREVGTGSVTRPSRAVDPQIERLLRDQISQRDVVIDQLRRQLAAGPQQVGHEVRSADTANLRVRSPLARRRELGTVLRILREENGLTVKQVAERLICSPGKVRDMEASFRAGTIRDVRDLCDLYGVTDRAERDRMMALAREGKQKGWWQSYDLAYATYAGLEAEAVSISGFHLSVIHGLLQTADYARAGHEGAMPRLKPDQIDKQIEAKLTRQRILTEASPPRFTAILDEAALHRVVGGRQVMASQLAKILEISALPNVVVQVLPYDLGAHPAVESNFTILELPSPTTGIVFVEGLVGSIYLERTEDLRRYHEIFDVLKSIALNPEQTAALIARLRSSYEADLCRA